MHLCHGQNTKTQLCRTEAEAGHSSAARTREDPSSFRFIQNSESFSSFLLSLTSKSGLFHLMCTLIETNLSACSFGELSQIYLSLFTLQPVLAILNWMRYSLPGEYRNDQIFLLKYSTMTYNCDSKITGPTRCFIYFYREPGNRSESLVHSKILSDWMNRLYTGIQGG